MIGSIDCENATPCALEIAARQTAPRTMIGSRTTNRNRIPSIDPTSVLQIASVTTQPYSPIDGERYRPSPKNGLMGPVEFSECLARVLLDAASVGCRCCAVA